ncbi:MAG: replication initiation protein [Lachnospiraceae bacterium]|nr:replication initiation protein [Lachnospiraceae bacterium]
MKQETSLDARSNYVRKANALIQKSRFSLSTQQQKIILYLISQISPSDKEFHVYSFSISSFCKICGINNSGANYEDLKEQIKKIADKSLWLISEDGKKENLIRWIEEPEIVLNTGIINLRLNERLKPYLLELRKSFTQYQIIYTLYFHSKYSIRLYELICSIHYHEMQEYRKQYSVDELKSLLDSDGYNNYKDFKRRVLNKAISEINEHSDKNVSYNTITQGRKVVGIELIISTKDSLATAKIRSDIEHEFGPEQITLWDRLEEKGLV